MVVAPDLHRLFASWQSGRKKASGVSTGGLMDGGIVKATGERKPYWLAACLNDRNTRPLLRPLILRQRHPHR